ncbi:transposase family protein [Roseomonas acroporae]|uniref:transposase family protein n=1 Tax=Roseomonas acroporae TaxID=2937791 RepID=UPI0038CF3CCE
MNVWRGAHLHRSLVLVEAPLALDPGRAAGAADPAHPDRLTIVVTPLQPQAACPICGIPSRHIHSRYDRVLHDLPWQGRPVRLLVRARRFRCHQPAHGEHGGAAPRRLARRLQRTAVRLGQRFAVARCSRRGFTPPGVSARRRSALGHSQAERTRSAARKIRRIKAGTASGTEVAPAIGFTHFQATGRIRPAGKCSRRASARHAWPGARLNAV